MKYEYVVDTMGDGIIESMECKNGKICDDLDSSCWEEHEMDYGNYSLYDALEKNTRDKYIYMDI